MKSKFVILLSTLAAASISYWAGMCGVTSSCNYYKQLGKFSFTVFEPVFFFSLSVIPIALAIFLAKGRAYKRILRLTSWWLPLTAILVLITPVSSGSWMPLFFVGKDGVALLMGVLFSVISLIVILMGRKEK